MHRTRHILIALLLILTVSFPAHAWISIVNGPLETLFAAKKPMNVWLVEFSAIGAVDPSLIEGGPTPFSVNVSNVLFGDAQFKDKTIDFKQAFSWPETLVPLKKGNRCIIFLDDSDEPQIRTVIPVHSPSLDKAANLNALKTLIVNELIQVLQNEKDVPRQREVILQLAPLMAREQAKTLIPFLESKDEWLRRAALSGLVTVTREPKYVKLAAEDLHRFFKANKKDDMIENFIGLEGGKASYAPYPLIFKYYELSQSYSQEEERAKALPLLPLYRVVALDLQDDKMDRQLYGIAKIYRYGTRDDIPFIYKDHDSPDPHTRACCLSAISRILKLGIIYTSDENFVEQEAAQQALVRKAIDLMNLEQAH